MRRRRHDREHVSKYALLEPSFPENMIYECVCWLTRLRGGRYAVVSTMAVESKKIGD